MSSQRLGKLRGMGCIRATLRNPALFFDGVHGACGAKHGIGRGTRRLAAAFLRRALPIRAAPVGWESRRVPQRSGLDRLGLKVKEAQELTPVQGSMRSSNVLLSR
jgi:hypothetical protein